MGNAFKFLIVILFCILGVAAITGTGGRYAGSSGQLAAFETQTSGRKLYNQYCARCHAADGRSQNPIGLKLDAPDITGGRSVESISHKVANGKGKMPAFKKRLSPQQISAVSMYVHSL
jgi:cytochrome c6